MVEAFEVMILAILSVAVKCEWNLSYAEEATISTVSGVRSCVQYDIVYVCVTHV